jgi:hypothetical protein
MEELLSEYTRLIYMRKSGDLKVYAIELKRYFKIITVFNGNSAAHSFVDKNTGDVYRPSTFVSPCKNPKYNILEEESRQCLFKECEYSGIYLR